MRNRLDDQKVRHMDVEMRDDPRMSPSLGCGKAANICSMKLSGHPSWFMSPRDQGTKPVQHPVH